MAELSRAEEMLSQKGIHGYFLGEPLAGEVLVVDQLKNVALPRLIELIQESNDPVFDEHDRRALELAVVETPPETRMSWQQLCRYFEVAIHGPDRFSRGLASPGETPQTIASFTSLLRAFRAEYVSQKND